MKVGRATTTVAYLWEHAAGSETDRDLITLFQPVEPLGM
jgi:hypothetical protein